MFIVDRKIATSVLMEDVNFACGLPLRGQTCRGHGGGVGETPHINWIKGTVGQSLFLSTTFSVGYFSILNWPECLSFSVML